MHYFKERGNNFFSANYYIQICLDASHCLWGSKYKIIDILSLEYNQVTILKEIFIKKKKKEETCKNLFSHGNINS